MVEAILEILGRAPGPVRRRALLDELARRGRRLSLAGLNRLLQSTEGAGLTVQTDEGVRLVRRGLPP